MHRSGFNGFVHARLERLTALYRRGVVRSSGKPVIFILVLLAAFGASAVLLRFVPSELAPTEDRGVLHVSVTGPEGAGFDYTIGQMQQVEEKFFGLIGEGGPIERFNSRVPGSYGSSQRCIPVASRYSSRTGQNARKRRRK